MNERLKSLLVYAAKCVSAVLVVYLMSAALHYHDIAWCLISVILVLSADGKDALPLAMTRIKANLVGAGVGVICLLFISPGMWCLCIALSITLSCCYLLKFDTAIKSALAATIIIIMHEEGKHLWDTALERVIAVVAGCALGLIVTFLFHFKEKTETVKTAGSDEA